MILNKETQIIAMIIMNLQTVYFPLLYRVCHWCSCWYRLRIVSISIKKYIYFKVKPDWGIFRIPSCLWCPNWLLDWQHLSVSVFCRCCFNKLDIMWHSRNSWDSKCEYVLCKVQKYQMNDYLNIYSVLIFHGFGGMIMVWPNRYEKIWIFMWYYEQYRCKTKIF